MAVPPILPHRVTFLAPRLTLPSNAVHLEQAAALLLFVTIFEHMLRHPSVSMTDPDDHRLVDGDDRLLTIDHPEIDEIRSTEFGGGRRDELIWLDISLDPSRPAPVRLHAERFDGLHGEFVAMGQAPLGSQIDNCIGQWLSAIGRPPPPRSLEPFSADDFLYAAGCGYGALQSRTPDGGVDLTIPARLQVPFFRFVYVTMNIYTWREILERDPDNPWAIRDMFLDGIHNDGPTTRDPIRGGIKTAPMFGKSYLSMFGEGVSTDDEVDAFAMASLLIPGNAFSLKDYGYTLDRVERWPDAARYAERACRSMPLMLSAHQLAMVAYDTCRYGELLRTAEHHIGFLEHLVEREAIETDDPDMRHCRLRYADTLMRAGRLDEAIELRARALQGLEGSWPNQTKLLNEWRTDPALFATLYAREGYLRGDPGRVIEGFSASPPDGASELGMHIEGLIALGKEDLAALAFSHYKRTKFTINPISRLAGAKAYALTGNVEGAIEQLQKLGLGFPHLGWDTAVNRVLRLLSGRGPQAWESVVQTRLQMGANRLAKLIARDAADFVPGIAPNGAVAHAVSGRAPTQFDPSIFAELRKLLEQYGLNESEQLFAQWTQPTLEHADRLANAWANLIPEEPDEDAPEQAHLSRAGKIVWGFASAFGRYLALTTQPPNVLAGGYRQVASDALELMRSIRGLLPRMVYRKLFEGLERVAGSVDTWLLDSWILRFERALDLEANEGGHLEPLTRGLPWMTWFLRGDERIGYEYKLGKEALAAAQAGATPPHVPGEAFALLERSLRAFGRTAAPKWSRAAEAANLPPEQAIDVHLTAAFAHTGWANAAVAAAKLLIPRGQGKAAFDTLCENLPAAGGDWRQARVAEMAAAWSQAQMPCPSDWNAAYQLGMNAFQQGNFPVAVEAHRWCLANDPDNAQAWRNLGLAYARMGLAHESIAAFAKADTRQAPSWAGQALGEAEHFDQAIRVYRYASAWFRTADEWLALGGTAAMAEDAEASAEAYGRAITMNPQAATLNTLHQLADALGEIGDYARCAEVAQRLQQSAQGDPTYTPCALYHMGTALLGMGRFQEAAQYAEQALARNQFPENQAPYAENLDRARRGDPRQPKPSRATSPEGRAWTLLADGDFKSAAALQPGQSWKVRRAILSASEFRYESENESQVTPRAFDAARRALEETPGHTDADGSLYRIQALRLRENRAFPVDVPCTMGTRVPREQFRQLFFQRAGGGVPMGAPPPMQPTGGNPAHPDPVVFPGQRVARLSDYVRIIKGMQTGDMNGALRAAGIDMNEYTQVAAAWGQRLAQDPSLMEKFQRMLQS